MLEQQFEELPHEQLVAAKSLILFTSMFWFIVHSMHAACHCFIFHLVNSYETKLDTSEQIAIK